MKRKRKCLKLFLKKVVDSINIYIYIFYIVILLWHRYIYISLLLYTDFNKKKKELSKIIFNNEKNILNNIICLFRHIMHFVFIFFFNLDEIKKQYLNIVEIIFIFKLFIIM